MRLGLFGRFLAITIGLLALVATILLTVMMRVASRESLNEITQRGHLLAAGLAEAASAGVETQNVYRTLNPLVASVLKQDDVAYLHILDARGLVLASSSLAPGARLAAAGLPSGGDLIEAVAVVRAGAGASRRESRALGREAGARIGEVRIGLSLAYHRARLRRAISLAGLLTVLASALAILVAWLFYRPVLKRIVALVGATDRVGGGDYTAQLPEREGDELDDIAEGFNLMVRRLKAADLVVSRRLGILQHLGLRFDVQVMLEEDRGELIGKLADVVRDELGVERVTIFVASETGGLVSETGHGISEPLRLEAGQGIAGHVARTGKAYYTNDASQDPHFYRTVDEATGFVTRNILAVPCGDPAKPSAVVEFLNREGGFGLPHVRVAEEASSLVHVVLERLKLVKALQVMNATLQETDRIRTEFLTNVSHELRTPLVSLSVALDLLEDSFAGKLSGRDAELLQVVRRNYRRLERQVRDLLYLTRMERGHVVSAISEVSVPNAVEVALEQFKTAFHDKQFRVVTDLGRDLPVILADPEQVDQILTNLLTNAGKFTPARGTVGVEARREGAGIRLSVWDTGPGVPKEYRDQIFEKFFRVPGVQAPGTGIGLAIVKGVVEQHGGRIWVENGAGRGSRFQVYLPARSALTSRGGRGT